MEWIWFEGPVAPGTVVTFKLRRARQTAFLVTTVEPERELALRVSFGPLARLDVIVGIEARDRGSSIFWTVKAGGVLGSLGLAFIGKRIARDAPAALAGLARYASDPEKKEAR
jgi:hypothetical protein